MTLMKLRHRLERFFENYSEIFKKKGETILRADEVPSGVFYLKEGFAKIYFVSEDGKELIISILSPGSFFPFSWVLSDLQNNYFVDLMTDATLLRAPREDFAEFLKKEPLLTFAVTEKMLLGFREWLTTTEKLIMSDAQQKICFTIYRVASSWGVVQKNGSILIDIPLTHQDIASLSGLTRETTSIKLKELERKGVLGRQKRKIIIKKYETLKDSFNSSFQDNCILDSGSGKNGKSQLFDDKAFKDADKKRSDSARWGESYTSFLL